MNDDARDPFPDVDADSALRAAFKLRGSTGSAREHERAPGSAAARALERAPPARARDDYTVEREIARGGMGVIVKAFDRELARDVALKLLREEFVARPRHVQRFFEEARITARLDHPGIVPVHQVGRDEAGRAWFAMRLVRGRDLGVILGLADAEREGWNQTRALSVILKVCEAMAYAHEQGVIHRDLKPANVMVGEFGEVYVMDWGLARVLGAADAHDLRLRAPQDGAAVARAADARGPARESAPGTASPIVTMDGEVLGTPCYMAPEQAQGRISELGPRSDVYSVGALLYHLLGGQMPYVPQGETRASREVLAQLAEGPPPSLHAVRPGLPAELIAICETAMARDPRERYAGMRQMAEDLRAFLEQRVVRAYETGAWAEAKKWLRRNRALAGALAGVVVALVTGLAVSLALKARSDANFVRAEDNARSASAARDDAEAFASVLEETLRGVTPSVALGRDTTMLREMMESAWSRVEAGSLAAAPASELRLMLVIGSAFRQLGAFDRAEPILDAASRKAARLFDADHELLARSHVELANFANARGDPARAEPHARAALDMNRRLHPGDDARTADSIEPLASALHHKGDLPGAETLMREALDMRRRITPGDHRVIALNLHNLAVVLERRGALQEAEELHREVFAMLERLGLAADPIAAGSLDSIGVALFQRGDAAGAEDHHRRALELRRRLIAGDNPETAASLVNLAAVLNARGDRAGAEATFREGLAMQRRLYPGDHEEVALSIGNLAATLHSGGDLAGAEPLYAESLAMQERLFPGDHPARPMQMNNFAQLKRARGDVAGAEAMLRDGLAMARRLYAGAHPETALLLGSLASLLQSREDLAGAEELYRAALQMRTQVLARPHPDRVKSQHALARVLELRGELAGAEASYRDAAREAGELGAGQVARLAHATLGLGRTLLHQARFADAEGVLQEAERLLREAPGTTAESRVECLELLIETCTRWDAAEPERGHADDAARWREQLAAGAAPR